MGWGSTTRGYTRDTPFEALNRPCDDRGPRHARQHGGRVSPGRRTGLVGDVRCYGPRGRDAGGRRFAPGGRRPARCYPCPMDPKPRPNHQLYLEALRRLTPEQRLLKAFELTELSRELLRAGVGEALPQAGAQALARQFGELEGLEKALLRREPAERLEVELVVRPRLGVHGARIAPGTKPTVSANASGPDQPSARPMNVASAGATRCQ